MSFRMVHTNFNVFNLEKSLAFYAEALGFTEVRRKTAPDGSFIIAFLGDGTGGHQLELTWLAEQPKAYDLGDNEIHLGVRTQNYAAAHEKHAAMGCICFENPAMGIYFINDPDGYWIEIIPERE